MFVPNFKMLGTVVPEKSLTKKKVYTQTNTHTHTHTEKAKTIYPLYTSYTGGSYTGGIIKGYMKWLKEKQGRR